MSRGADSKVLLALGLTLFVVMMAASCAPARDPEPADDPVSELRIGRAEDSESLDPHVQTTAPEVWVYDHIYETLVTVDENMDIQPQLATEWEVIDETTWRFHLRDDVEFHDGTKFNAEAAEFAIERAIDPEKPARGRAWIGPISGAEVVDEYTLDVTTSTPFGPTLHSMTMVYVLGMVSPAAVEEHGDAYGRNPVGTGPYEFVSWATDEEIVLEVNENYWGDRPGVDRLIFKVIPEEGTRAMAFDRCDIDFLLHPPAPQLQGYRDDPDVIVEEVTGMRTFYLGFICSEPPFDDVRVRQAVHHAIDVDSIVEHVAPELTVRAQGFDAPVAFGFEDAGLVDRYQFDPDKALDILADVGWEMGDDDVLRRNGERFEVEFVTSEGRDIKSREVAEAIQAQLADVGIKANLEVMEWGAFLDEVASAGWADNWNLFTLGWSNLTGDSDYGLYSLFHSEPSPGEVNRMRYENAELDQLLDIGRQSADPDERLSAYARAHEILTEELPWVPIYQTNEIRVMKSHVTNYLNHPGEYYLRLQTIELTD